MFPWKTSITVCPVLVIHIGQEKNRASVDCVIIDIVVVINICKAVRKGVKSFCAFSTKHIH